MSKMCHAAESEEANMDGVHNAPTCSDSCWENCAHGNKLSVVNGETERPRIQISPCGTPYGTPLFSRESSFSSFASCFSRLGMFSVHSSLIAEISTTSIIMIFLSWPNFIYILYFSQITSTWILTLKRILSS
jgi:1-phosphatidylinositol-3-phosphate 5-kinase